MKEHDLKTQQPYFEKCWEGKKPFEIRENDREFEEGDFICLKEFNADSGFYSGREVEGVILYVLRDYHAIKKGHVAFGYSITNRKI